MKDDKIEKITHMTFYEFYKQEEKLILAEGLIKSYPILNFKLAVLHTFREHLLHIGIGQSFGMDMNLVIVLDEGDEDVLKEIEKFADTYGYHLGFTKKLLYKGKACKSHQFDPKYPIVIPKEYIPKVGFHIARNEHLKSIFEIGLTPKTSKSDFKHPGNRVYLLFANSINSILKTKEVLRGHVKRKKPNEIVELSVLKVNINEDLVYYFDPNLEPGDIDPECFGMFVLRNIHPAYVELLPELSDNKGVSSKDKEYHKNLKK